MNSSNETKHCTKCNAILNKNAAFCTECGEKYIEQSQNHEHTENAADQPKVSESTSKQPNTQKDKSASKNKVIFEDIIAMIPVFIGIAMISYGWCGFERADEDYYSLGDIAKAIYISTGFLIVCLKFLFINLDEYLKNILNTENNKSNMKESSKQNN